MAILAIELVVVVHLAVLAVPVALGEGVGRVVATDGHVVGVAQVDAGATVAVLCLPTVHSCAIWLGLGSGLVFQQFIAYRHLAHVLETFHEKRRARGAASREGLLWAGCYGRGCVGRCNP